MAYTDTERYEAQQKVAAWLRGKGLTVKHAGEFGDFNLYTPKMTRIRVRWAPYKQIEFGLPQKGWKVALTNNGSVNERNVDFYVLVLGYDEQLADLGITKPIYIVKRSPLQQTVITINIRHLLSGKWGSHFDDWRSIMMFDDAKK